MSPPQDSDLSACPLAFREAMRAGLDEAEHGSGLGHDEFMKQLEEEFGIEPEPAPTS